MEWVRRPTKDSKIMASKRTDTISVAQFRRDFASIARRARRGGRFLVEQEGASLAIISPKLLERLLEDADDRRVIARRRGEASVPWNKVKAQLGL